MKMNKFKATALTLMTAGTLAVSAFPSLASTSGEKVSTVKINLNLENIPAMGDEVDDDLDGEVTSAEDAYSITDVEYYNSDDEWEYGDNPVIKAVVEINDEDDYYFPSGVKVKISNKNVSVSSVSISRSSSSKAKITIKLKQIDGDLDAPEDPEWSSSGVASWSESDYASSYSVKLYRGSSTVTTISTTSTYYDFSGYMTTAGYYTFKVKAVASDTSDNSSWSDESDELYVSSDTASYNKTHASTTLSTASPTSTSSGWQSDSNGWYYVQNGTALRSTWFQDSDGRWYYLNSNGYMHTGWFQDSDGRWYYMNPNAGGPQGSMMTGLVTIGNYTYYLNPNSGGPKGSMVTGYVTIDGTQYYFDPVSGAAR